MLHTAVMKMSFLLRLMGKPSDPPQPAPQQRSLTPKQKIGLEAEAQAASLLEEKGYKILDRNWRHGRGELDLIALQKTPEGPVQVFIEVRARHADALVPGYWSIDKNKRLLLVRTAYAYRRKHKPNPSTFRFDVIQLAHRQPLPPEILHFENVPFFHRSRRR